MPITLVTSETTTSSGTVTLPSSIQAGDVVIAAINNSVPATPGGWTEVTGGSGSRVVYRRSTNGDGMAGSSVQFGTGTAYGIIVCVYRGVGAVGAGATGSGASTTATWASFNPSAPTARMFRVAMQFSGASDYMALPSDTTERGTRHFNTYGTVVGDTDYINTGGQVTATVTSHTWRTFYLELYDLPTEKDIYVVDTQGTDDNTSLDTSITVTLPSGYQAGDLLFILVGQGTNSTISTPSGWTLLSNNSTRAILIAKIADGTEGSTVSVTSGTSSGWQAASWAIRNWGKAGDAPSIATHVDVVQSADSTSSTPSFTVNGTDASWDNGQWILALAIAWVDWGSTINWTTATPSGYTNMINTDSAANSDSCGAVSISYRHVAPGSTQPGALAINANKPWETYTVNVLGMRVEDSGNGLFLGF